MAPSITVVYVTIRPSVCVGEFVAAQHQMVWVPEPEQNQYRLLASCLAAQTFRDFEVVVVDGLNELPQPELDALGDRVRYVRPRHTPWNDLRATDHSVSRNSGILAATGDVVVGLDDCVSFGPDLLARVASYAARGVYPVLHDKEDANENRPPLDAPRSRAGGVLAYPRRVALDVAGYEERFSGCKALEDWEFSERLVRHGVRFVSNREARVTLHGHRDHGREVLRCCWAVRELVAGQDRANQPWRPDQTAAFGDACPFSGAIERRGHQEQQLCILRAGYCDHRERPSGPARAIVRGYESQPFSPFSAP